MSTLEIRYAIQRYHARRPGHIHDHYDEEIDLEVKLWLANDLKRWSEAEQAEILKDIAGFNQYLQTITPGVQPAHVHQADGGVLSTCKICNQYMGRPRL